MSGRAAIRRDPAQEAWEGNRVLIDPCRVAKRLLELRRRARLTQGQVGDGSGIGHRTLIARAESGRHELTLDTIARICSACGVSITEVFRAEL